MKYAHLENATQALSCPLCGSNRGGIIDSRVRQGALIGGHPYVHRTRLCIDCEHRWRTVEMPAGLVMDALEARKVVERAIKVLTASVVHRPHGRADPEPAVADTAEPRQS